MTRITSLCLRFHTQRQNAVTRGLRFMAATAGRAQM